MNMRVKAPPLARATLLAAVCGGLLLPPPLAAQQAARQNQQALRASTPVTLNFVNADIEAVTRAIAAMLDRQMLVDPRVRGNITVYSEQPVSVREAYMIYLASLRGLGFAVVENGGLLKIVPEADAKLQAGTVSVGQPSQRGDQIMTQIFRLNFENPNNLVAVLRPLISANNTINANPSNNSLVITDYADNLQRIAKIIAALDQPASTDIDVIPVQHAVAADIAALVQRLSDGGGGGGAVPGVPVTTTGGSGSILADARSNTLIVRAANPVRLAQIRSIVEKLDRPTQGGGPGGNIWVVYLKNADAVKLATVLRAAFGGSGGSSSGGSSSSSPSSSSLGGLSQSSSLQNTASQLGGSSSSGSSTASSAPLSASAGPSTGGNIQADPSTNSLIITAPEPLYRQMRAAIEQLDARRVQIYVESMIVKVDANKAAEFGVQWQGLLGKSDGKNFLLSGTNFGTGSTNIVNLAGAISTGEVAADASLNGLNLIFGRRVGNMITMGALARFLETNTGANVLSTPNLVALDNEEAKIVIGQNVPFITGSFTNTGATGGTVNPFQTIERKDVGLTLRIKSQIGEGGAIRMTIFQENSSVVPGASTTAGPTTDKSSIETSVVVDDGQIIVLGGLLKDEYTDGEDRVPGLASLPVVGNLFRSESRKRVKSNLMVFLRPVVVRDQATADSLTLDRYQSIRSLQQNSQPHESSILQINQSPILPPVTIPERPVPLPTPLGESETPPPIKRP
jgi:general secretion pathway protein D